MLAWVIRPLVRMGQERLGYRAIEEIDQQELLCVEVSGLEQLQ